MSQFTPYSILSPYLESLQPSKAVYKIKIQHSDISASLVEEAKCKPQIVQGDVFSTLIAEHFSEARFISADRVYCKIDKDHIMSRVITNTMSSLRLFLEKHIPAKAPTQTKLYRAHREYCRYGNCPDSYKYGILMLYKYIYNITGPSMVFSDKNSPHIKNVLLIMERMVEKHENS